MPDLVQSFLTPHYVFRGTSYILSGACVALSSVFFVAAHNHAQKPLPKLERAEREAIVRSVLLENAETSIGTQFEKRASPVTLAASSADPVLAEEIKARSDSKAQAKINAFHEQTKVHIASGVLFAVLASIGLGFGIDFHRKLKRETAPVLII